MIDLLKNFLSILNPRRRNSFYALQGLYVVMAVSEVAGIASVAPFMALVGDIQLIDSSPIFSKVYEISGVSSPNEFLFTAGVFVLFMLAFSSLISALTTWASATFAATVGAESADRLYEFYLKQGWVFHSSQSSSELVKKIASEVVRVTDLVILPLVLMISKTFLILFIVTGLLLYQPAVAAFSFIIFSFFYFLIFSFVKSRLLHNGRALTSLAGERYRLMNEAFGGIKDVILLDRAQYYTLKFQETGLAFAAARAGNHVLWQIPKYFIELLAFGLIIIFVLYSLRSNQSSLGSILPILSVYAVAGVRLLPALQQVYAAMGQIRGNISALDSIKGDLDSCSLAQSADFEKTPHEADFVDFQPFSSIEIKDVAFAYPGKANCIHSASLKISAYERIGFVGPSGAGKSTVVEIILGLLEPQRGSLLINDELIGVSSVNRWRRMVGFVPQSIFLTEGTIAENIAFGVEKDLIDYRSVERAINLACLTDVVASHPSGVNAKVGERGVQLSGGQRQRLGIARALYNDPEVLVFDEATSALDGITENVIMDAIEGFSGKKTIIIVAHRLKTVSSCDRIFFMEGGRIVDQGNYIELFEKNSKFRTMVELG